ncbi:MAG TPA: hypothetical protein EYP35_10350 [Desulfobacterales bacterium]|nr:hypothetical protein [Desulfobacterales bacterium]HIP38712.1 hypothetical protein [Desulfocapsa sulfexigens]
MQIDKGRLIQEAVARLSKLGEGEGLLLQPYKKDRSVYVIRRENTYLVVERGFARKEFIVDTKKIKKLLKTLCRKEFPRSNRIWLNYVSQENAVKFNSF